MARAILCGVESVIFDVAPEVPDFPDTEYIETDVTDQFPSNIYDDHSEYCPPDIENGDTFSMLRLDYSCTYVAYSKYSTTPGQIYKFVCTPMSSSNLWENFVFAKNDYYSLAVIANDESVGQYVKKLDANTFMVTMPDCNMFFLNAIVGAEFKAYLIEEV